MAVRGMRLQMSEVEFHLNQSPLVRHAVVDFPQRGACTGQLVAMITLQQQATSQAPISLKLCAETDRTRTNAQITQVEDFLAARMPAYGIPSIWFAFEDLPRNTNGKIDRRQVKDWLANTDRDLVDNAMALSETQGDDRPDTPVELQLQIVLSEVLNISKEHVHRGSSFVRLGGDSISAISLVSACRALGLKTSVQDILRCKTLSSLASMVTLRTSVTVHPEERPDCLFDLAPIQAMHLADAGISERFNQSILVQVKTPASKATLCRALREIQNQHSMLRGRFVRTGSRQWQQSIGPRDTVTLQFHAYTIALPDEILALVERTQATIDATKGPVFAAAAFNYTSGDQILFLTAHHLVVDLVSWRIILHDLECLLRDQTAKLQPALSFQTWCDWQAAQIARDTRTPSEILPHEVPAADYAYWGIAPGENIEGDVITTSFSLSSTDSEVLLAQANRPLRTEPVDILHAALAHSYAHVFEDRPSVSLFTEAHGRETGNSDIELDRTVGWFTTIYPLFVRDVAALDVVEAVARFKDVRRRIPQNGWPYFTSRQLKQTGFNAFSDHFPVELLFNFSGSYQRLERDSSMFVPISDETIQQSDRSARLPRRSLINIGAHTFRGAISLSFTHNRHMRHIDKIKRWAKVCKLRLEEMSRQLPRLAPTWTLSDAPLLPVSYQILAATVKTALDTLKDGAVEQLEAIYPVAPMQEGILLARMKNADHYSVRSLARITLATVLGQARSDLEQAWQRVVVRHPALRTVFTTSSRHDALFEQVVLTPESCTGETIFLDNETDALSTLQSHSTTHFEEHRPAQRMLISRDADGSLYCRLEILHALTDAASMAIIWSDFCQSIDQRLASGPGPDLGDYIRHVQAQHIELSTKYWQDYLQGADTCLFPTLTDDAKQPEVLSGSVQTSFGQTAALRAFCASFGFTTFTVVQVAWAMVLRAYTGLEDVCFGYLDSGRDLPVEQAGSMVGPMISMLICRVQFQQKQGASDLLRDVQDRHLQNLDHRVYSLAALHRNLGVSDTGLFNTAISVQSLRSRGRSTQSQTTYELIGGEDPSEYDVVVQVADMDDDLEIGLRYHSDKLSSDYAASVIRTFEHIICHIVRNPQESSHRMSPVHERDREWLEKWNGDMPARAPRYTHQLFETRAQSCPEAEAICSADLSMTYGEVDEYANRLAAQLQLHNVRPGVFVPFCMEKSAWGVVSIIAVMKAGGGCVPMDPSWPTSRTRHVIAQTRARVLLASSSQATTLRQFVPDVLVVDSDWSSFPGVNSAPVVAELKPTSPCHCMFTSGSTGVPKGVVWTYESLASSITHQVSAIHIDASTRMYQFAAYVWDVSMAEILSTLVAGGCVCVPNDYERLNGTESAIDRMHANWALFTPTFARSLEPSSVSSLQVLALGGEAVDADTVSRWRPHVPNLLHLYGPCEGGIYSAMGCITANNAANQLTHGIGSRCWVVHPLNPDALAPIGVVGELCIEGPILALGYLNDPETTAASFIYNPAWAPVDRSTRDRRFYKTGDLARFDFLGRLSMIGRKDNQLKVRGQRLDPAETEHALLAANIFPDAVVMVPESGPLAARLTAVMEVGQDKASLLDTTALIQLVDAVRHKTIARSLHSLERHAAQTLPAHGVPSFWIPVVRLPHLLSGKIDRRAIKNYLTGLDQATFDDLAVALRSEPIESPSSTLEQTVQQIWSEVLGVPSTSIGRNSSFLNLGGDSISAVKSITRFRRQGLRVSVQDLLRTKSLADLAGRVREIAPPKHDILDTPNQPFELSPVQRLRTLQDPSCRARFNQSVLLRFTRQVNFEELKDAIAAIVRHHGMLRARVLQSSDGSWTQSISDGTSSYSLHPHVLNDLLEAQPFIEDAQRSIDPLIGHVLAARLFSVQDRCQYVFMTAHHMFVDFVSWNIICQDLEQLLSTSRPLVCQTQPFSAYSSSLRAFAQEWATTRRVMPDPVPPTDFAFWAMENQPNVDADTVSLDFTLDPHLTSHILKDANAAFGTEPIDLIIASIAASYAQTFDRAVPAIYNEVHGREAWDDMIDVGRTVGWFTALCPINLPLIQPTIGAIRAAAMVKDERRRIPHNGLFHFANQFNKLTDGGLSATQAEILLNYAGSTTSNSSGALFKPVDDHGLSTSDSATDTPRFGLISISAREENHGLRMGFTYNMLMLHQDKIQRWIRTCECMLRELAETLPQLPPQPSLGDFTLVYEGRHYLDGVLLAAKEQGNIEAVDVEDVTVATGFQRECLLQSLSESRGMFNHHVLQYWGAVDRSCLQQACKQLVQRHSILRSRFVEYNGQTYQITQRSLDCRLEYFSARNSAATAHEGIAECISEDLEQPFHYGSRLVRFMLIEHEAEHHSLIWRLPHAAYDATSLAILLEDFRALYNQADLFTIVESSPFYLYRADSSERAKRYWRDYLDGSTITEAFAPEAKRRSGPIDSTVHRYCRIRRPYAEDATAADISKAAWILGLGQWSKRTDIVLRELVRGRSCPVPDIERMTSVCANVIPLRIKLRQFMTGIDVLRAVRESHLSSMPFENYDWPRIATECTSWTEREVGVTLNHVRPLSRKGNEGPEDVSMPEESQWVLEEVHAPPVEGQGLDVTAFEVDGGLRFEAHFSSCVASQNEVEALLDVVERMVSFLGSYANRTIDSVT